MTILNVEIKARSESPENIRSILREEKADYRGTDHQVDTYFIVPEGRLKLREGTIENNLIFYRRSDSKDPKSSSIDLMPVENPAELKAVLSSALDVKVVVDKRREIYFIDNVKFHVDEVDQLGWFVEIEAIDETGEIGEKKLREQCRHYLELLAIKEEELVAESYSDLLLKGS